MSTFDTLSMPPVLIYARLLRQNHELIARNEGDSPAAEALAEQMDRPWYALTAAEQRRMRGLSADLYALREGGPRRIAMSPEEFSAWQRTARHVSRRSQLDDVDALLDFLRQPIPSNLPPSVVPFLQAKSWEKLGDVETAHWFLREAERHDSKASVSVVAFLQQMGRDEDASEQGETVLASPPSPTNQENGERIEEVKQSQTHL